MAFTLLQVGSTLKSINTDGILSDALTLPSGIQLAVNRVPRFARFKRYVVLVNTPTKPLTIGPDGTVRQLTPDAPGSAVVLSAGAAGTLTGTYLAKQTYKFLDSDSNIIAESDYGTASNSQAIVTKKLHAAFTAAATGAISQIYRTTTNGSTYFAWSTAAAAVASIENDNSDDSLGTVSGPLLGTAPDLTLVCSWQGRLWGIARTAVDDLRYTESGTMYAWYSLNTIPIGKIGDDDAGVVALIPRRNVLGVARTKEFAQIAGTSRTNFSQSVRDGIGVLSQESVIVYQDVAYFLWRDGIYTWSDDGFKCISDGLVRSWFTTDDTFNRAMFWRSFATLDPVTLRYRLYLASAGSSTIDRWIEYDITTGKFWGPHSTSAFSPTCALTVAGADLQPYSMVGSTEEYLSLAQDTRTDWTSAIAMRARSKAHNQMEPDAEKYFGELSVLTQVQAGGTLSVTPTVGNQSAVAMNAWSHAMTLERRRLGRLGHGRLATVEFTNSEAGRDVVLYGYEIDPVHRIGRR